MHILFTKPRLWKTCEQRKTHKVINAFGVCEDELFTAFSS